jgi:uncharacterized protein YkwD
MNWVDIVLLVVILLATWAGWAQGFIIGSLGLLTWIASLVLGYVFYPRTALFLERFLELGAWQMPVAFILTCLIARLVIGLISAAIIRSIPERVNSGGVNRFLGIIPGIIKGWIWAVIIAALLLALPLKDTITQATRESTLGVRLAMQSEWANKKLAPVFDEAVRQTMNSLIVNPNSNENVPLGFTYDNPDVRPELESQMLQLVNEERAKEGLLPLKADPEMTGVARAHSRDMFAKGYFAHENLEGQDPFDRMTEANVKFRTAGENLALAQTLEIAHRNLMNSPGHRANIMNPAFGRLGIGVLDGGFYGLMISQEFRE